MLSQGLNPNEQWRPVPGHPNYEISNDGRIFSKRRPRIAAKIMKTFFRSGYPSVNLNAGEKRWQGCIHRLLWISFHGPIPHGMEIDHINRIRTDNRLENLRLVTPSGQAINRLPWRKNHSGIRGVYLRRGRWIATLTAHRRGVYIGTFASIEEAKEARRRAEKIHFSIPCPS